MVRASLYCERGLLHLFVNYDEPPPWLSAPIDPMNDEGAVQISPELDQSMDIYRDCIDSNLV